MQKVIKNIGKNIIQVTVADERWYIKENPDTLEVKFVPSVTWICSYYPKGIAFYKWLSQRSWDESEALKQAAGDKGSKVHYAIGDLLNGKTVKMDSKYVNPTTNEPEELTLEEYEAIMSFVAWHNDVKPEFIANEITVFNETIGYAGTIDYTCKINNELFIVDFKTSASIWPEHELQLSAYKHASNITAKIAVLQIGYSRNKKGYRFTELEDKFDLFLSAQKMWENENKNVEPKKKDYPVELSLGEKQ